MAMQIQLLDAPEAAERLAALADLLQDAVHSGASVGFLAPLSAQAARAYWLDLLGALVAQSLYLLIATDDDRIVGTVQLVLAQRQNASHRAEVAKLLVHSSARRRGIGLALMQAAEQQARAVGRSLLVLDTRAGDPSEQLYIRLGYQHAGSIPGYTCSADGRMHATVIMYKLLPPAGMGLNV